LKPVFAYSVQLPLCIAIQDRRKDSIPCKCRLTFRSVLLLAFHALLTGMNERRRYENCKISQI